MKLDLNLNAEKKKMKVFWSWQSDREGKTCRHFVRNALEEAIQALKEDPEIEEPPGKAGRDDLHLDQDRQGVSGSPDLASLIFSKIKNSAVFVADVTLVGEVVGETKEAPKKLINPNVAIEYGYALHALGDEAILMVQNLHYGDRRDLPFDLQHKAGPIEYRLAPTASKEEITAEGKRLKAKFKEALKLCLSNADSRGYDRGRFDETKPTINRAYFWPPERAIAQYRSLSPTKIGELDIVEYRFNETRVFYFRLIPTTPLKNPLKLSMLHDLVQRRQVPVMTRTLGGFLPCDNEYGSISYDLIGADKLNAFTQLFQNGEVWAVTSELVAYFNSSYVVPMVSLENIYSEFFERVLHLARKQLGIPSPYNVEFGAVGLNEVRLSLPREQMRWANDVSEPIYKQELYIRRSVTDGMAETPREIVQEFLSELYDLARVKI